MFNVNSALSFEGCELPVCKGIDTLYVAVIAELAGFFSDKMSETSLLSLKLAKAHCKRASDSSSVYILLFVN